MNYLQAIYNRFNCVPLTASLRGLDKEQMLDLCFHYSNAFISIKPIPS